jgi:hypothetical protein
MPRRRRPRFVSTAGGGLVFNRAPALPRRALCLFRVPRPKPRLPEKVGTPVRKAARVVAAWRCPPPTPGAPKVKDWTRLRAARSWRSSARRRSSWTAASAVQEWTNNGKDLIACLSPPVPGKCLGCVLDMIRARRADSAKAVEEVTSNQRCRAMHTFKGLPNTFFVRPHPVAGALCAQQKHMAARLGQGA